MKIFIKRGNKFPDPQKWGICWSCNQDRCKPMCSSCLNKRNKFFQIRLENKINSLEYKVRKWLSNFFDPTFI